MVVNNQSSGTSFSGSGAANINSSAAQGYVIYPRRTYPDTRHEHNLDVFMEDSAYFLHQQKKRILKNHNLDSIKRIPTWAKVAGGLIIGLEVASGLGGLAVAGGVVALAAVGAVHIYDNFKQKSIGTKVSELDTQIETMNTAASNHAQLGPKKAYEGKLRQQINHALKDGHPVTIDTTQAFGFLDKSQDKIKALHKENNFWSRARIAAGGVVTAAIGGGVGSVLETAAISVPHDPTNPVMMISGVVGALAAGVFAWRHSENNLSGKKNSLGKRLLITTAATAIGGLAAAGLSRMALHDSFSTKASMQNFGFVEGALAITALYTDAKMRKSNKENAKNMQMINEFKENVEFMKHNGFENALPHPAEGSTYRVKRVVQP